MSFETEAQLSLTVDEGSLRSVRQQIEDGIGTTEIGVTDGGSMSAQSTGSSSGGRRGRRAMRLAEVRTERLEDIALYLESIDDVLSEGGLLGGGGLGGVGTELLGVGAETAGDVAVETGNTVTDAVIDTVTTGVGNALADFVPGGGSGGGGGDTLSPRVTTDTELSPTFSPVFRPTFQPEFSPQFAPEFTPELDVAPELNVSPQVDASPQVDVSPELNVDFPEFDFGSNIQNPHPVKVTNWPGAPSGGGGDGDGGLRPFENLPIVGGRAEQINDQADDFLDSVPIFRQIGEAAGTQSSDRSIRRGTAGATVNNNVDADISPRFTFNVDTDRLVNEVSREFDSAIRDVKSDLIDRIEEVESDVNDLERDIRR